MTAPAETPPTAPPERGPRAPKTVVRLENAWNRAPEFQQFKELWCEFCRRSEVAVARAAESTASMLGALPAYYLEEIRPATPYLFREWMPLGYAAMVGLPADALHADVATALLGYGTAVTLLDDVADTDEFESRFGPGCSLAIAERVREQLFPPHQRRGPLAPGPEAIANLAVAELRRYQRRVRALVSEPSQRMRIRRRVRDFLDSVATCRRVRRLLAEGRARDHDLRELADAAPQGMTVVMVGMLSAALHPHGDRSMERAALEDAAQAERICHYQNAIATLERERDSGDPTNPIVIGAIRRGDLDACAYMAKQLSPDEFERATAPSRRALQRDLDKRLERFESGAERYAGGARDFFERLRFGVRSLGLLYRVARGEI